MKHICPNTLILRVTTRALLWGWMVPILFLFENPKIGWMSILALFSLELESSIGSQATDITLDREDPVLPRAAKMTLIVPRGGLERVSFRGSKPVCSVRPLEWCKSSFNFPSWTSCSKWSHKFLHSSVVCPCS